MREIKFRAYDPDEKKVHPFSHILGFELDETGNLRATGLADKIYTKKTTAPVLLLQFTGLHDKNGKEIYEGDIVKDKWGTGSDVYWNDEIAAFAYKGGCDWGMLEPEFGELEVIGNIHENPELLKK